MCLLFELLSVEGGRDAVEGIVRAFVVVAFHPLVGKLADFVEGAEGVGIEDFGPEATVEAFDVAVLHGAAGLDEMEFDVMAVAPGLELGGDEFRAVIDPDLSR